MKRLQIMVNDDMLKKIEFYSEKMSVSKSSFCCMLIGQGLMQFDKSISLVDKNGGPHV